MTDTTHEAPERIRVWPDVNGHFNPARPDWTGGYWDDTNDPLGVEYVHGECFKTLERACAEWAEVSQRNYQRAKSYHEALERIAANQYGLQSIMEDYPDTDSVEYLQAALKYYTRLANSYQKTAREAISGAEGFEEVLQDFVRSQHRDAELDAIIEANIEELYEK
jgi:DNA repair ATPase RecN